jgi:hypothetical protein
MDYSFIVVLIVIVAGVAGFLVLARALIENWRAQSRGKEESDAYQSQRSKTFEKCFNKCMSAAHWEPDKRDSCDVLCRSGNDAYPNQPIA